MEDYDKYLEYLEYQKHYSNYTVDNYKEDIDVYLTTYETDTEMFEAFSYRKDILDKFTSYIDSMEDDLGEASLNELSNNKNDLKDKYPSLVLRKVKKKEVR